MGVGTAVVYQTLKMAEIYYDLKPDPTLHAERGFDIEDIPILDDDAESLIERLKIRFEQNHVTKTSAKLYQVKIHADGPIGIAMIGDPHVDNPGTNWPRLHHDISLLRKAREESLPVFAANVGDSSDNWVGRLAKLYAHSEVTARQSLSLVEWLLSSIPWIVTIGGNHDMWHTDTADPLDIIHRLMELPGLYQGHGARLRLNLPSGHSPTLHVRHDFPGRSQFNPSHGLVRQTLFDYRDNILACGHRHQSGYIPVWHNHPEPMMCHCFRVGSYKVHDDYADEKGFKDENWSPAMMAVISPDLAGNPVRFVKECFEIEEGVEYLQWRRKKWESSQTAA